MKHVQITIHPQFWVQNKDVIIVPYEALTLTLNVVLLVIKSNSSQRKLDIYWPINLADDNVQVHINDQVSILYMYFMNHLTIVSLFIFKTIFNEEFLMKLLSNRETCKVLK